MSLETSLFTLLGVLVGNRVAPVIFPQPPAVPTWPAIRYDIQITSIIDQCGAGDSDTGDVRVQLDAVAKDYDQAKALGVLVKAKMDTLDPPAILEFEGADYDEQTKTHRRVLQYSVHGSSNV